MGDSKPPKDRSKPQQFFRRVGLGLLVTIVVLLGVGEIGLLMHTPPEIREENPSQASKAPTPSDRDVPSLLAKKDDRVQPRADPPPLPASPSSPEVKLAATPKAGPEHLKRRLAGPRREGVPRPTHRVERISFSPDGRRVLTEYGCDKKALAGEVLRYLSLWDVDTGKELWTVQDPDLAVSAFWLAGTRHLLLTDTHGRLSVWDADQGPPGGAGKRLRTFGELSEGDNVKSVSADGRRALTNGPYGNRVWDVRAGRIVNYLNSPHGAGIAGTLSPDGKLALTTFAPFADSDAMALWDVDEGRVLRVWDRKSGWGGGIFAPDGNRVLSLASAGENGDYRLVLWEIASGKVVWKAQTGAAIAFTADGRNLLVLRDKEMVRVNLTSGRPVTMWNASLVKPQDKPRADALAFSPDCSRVVTARGEFGGQYAYTTIRLELWDVTNGRLLRKLAEITDRE